MVIIHPAALLTRNIWVERLIYALMIGGVTISLLIATSAIYAAFFNDPPVIVKSLDSPYLGVLCPGNAHDIHNEVEITDNIIIHYFVSVMDNEGKYNITGTQRAYTDFLHPYPAKFTHTLPWKVPELPPGRYLRVFAVRKVSGNQDTIFTESAFEIGEHCP